jgi:hypothetical protein
MRVFSFMSLTLFSDLKKAAIKLNHILKMNAREKDYGSYEKFEELLYSLPTISPSSL